MTCVDGSIVYFDSDYHASNLAWNLELVLNFTSRNH